MIVIVCLVVINVIGEVFRNICDGYLDLVFVGGVEVSINEIGIGGFVVLKVFLIEIDFNKVSCFFDKERSGFVMGEGFGVFILEFLESV